MVDQQRYLIRLIQNFEDLFNGALGMWKTETVELKLKEIEKPVSLRPYTVPKIHTVF